MREEDFEKAFAPHITAMAEGLRGGAFPILDGEIVSWSAWLARLAMSVVEATEAARVASDWSPPRDSNSEIRRA